MAATVTFHDVERKQAFDGVVQEVLLEPSKQYNDLELYLNDLMEYLHPQMDKMLSAKGRGIIFWWSVQVNYNAPLVKDVDEDDEEQWFDLHDDDDDEVRPVYLHSGKLQIPNTDFLAAKMAEARQIILERNSVSIRGKSNVVIDSIGNVCFKLVNNGSLLH